MTTFQDSYRALCATLPHLDETDGRILLALDAAGVLVLAGEMGHLTDTPAAAFRALEWDADVIDGSEELAEYLAETCPDPEHEPFFTACAFVLDSTGRRG